MSESRRFVNEYLVHGLIRGVAYIRGGGLISDCLSVSEYGGLIRGGRAYIQGAYIRSFMVVPARRRLS
jgi:hypothetical protein